VALEDFMIRKKGDENSEMILSALEALKLPFEEQNLQDIVLRWRLWIRRPWIF
jgi:hypothetical protein